MRLLLVATAVAVMMMSTTLTAAQTVAPVCSAFSKNLTECSANSAFCGIGVALGSNVETCRYKTCRDYNSTICNLIPACAMDGTVCGLKPCIAIPNNGTNCVDSGCQYVQGASVCGPSNCSALSATACPWNRCQVPSAVSGSCTFLQCTSVNPAVCRDVPGCNVSNTTANGPLCAPIVTTTTAAANVTTTLAPLTTTTAPTTINTTTAPRTTTPPVTAAPWTMPICSSFNLTSCPTDVCGRSSTTACKYKNCMEYNTSICSMVPACALDTATNTCTWKPCLKIPSDGTACFDSGCQRSPTSNTCAPPNCTALTATTCPLGRCVVSTTSGTSSAAGSCAFPSCSALPPMVCSEAPLCQLNSLGNCTDAVTLPATTAASGNTTAPITVMPTPSPMTDRPPVTNASTSNQTSDMPPQTPAMTTGAVAPQTTMVPETSAPMPANLPCLNYTAAACPLARCQIYSPSGVVGANIVRVCIPQQCKTLANQSVCIGACTWNGTSCDRTPCDKLNVDTCTPETCNIGTDGTCTGKPCNALSADGCDTTRCYVNSNGKCAAQTCEMITVATRCTNSACFWDASKNSCTTPPCASFVTATACPSPRCQVTSTGACGNAPCNTWMNAANCTVAPGCLWSTTQTCVDRPCQYFEATTCPIGRCQWDSKLKACTRPACSASNSSSSCPTDQCYWSTLTSTCSPIPCTQFTTNASCPVDRCYFNAKGCQELPCSLIAQQAVCALNAACTWSMPSTSGVSGSATVSGTCTAKVVDVPCAQRTDLTTCVLPQCYNDVAKGKCTNPPCNLYTSASACPTDRCAFNVSGNSACTPIPCLALPSSTTCSLFSDRCAWDSNSGWCKPVPCENLGNNCDLARCTLTSSGACASIRCEAQLVKSQCPTSSFDCMWWNNQCGYGNCVLLRNQSACGTDSKCTWATPANADATCIATSFLVSLPCSAFNGADFCASAPNSRCKWVSSQTTTGAVSGQCTPADLTSLLPCFNFTSQGQSACPTSYCAWWNNLCVNPLCTSATTQSGCKAWNCLWIASTTSADAGTCADQQWQQFPCSAFTAATCPAGRCSKNETKCVAFSSSSSGSSSSGSLSAAILAQLTTTSDGTWINATNGIPVDSTTKACLALTEARTCLLSTSACVWRGSLCTPPPCGQYTDDSCPTKRCRSIAGRCLEMCPASNPYYCYASGTCATQASACKTCPSSQVQCVVDSSCQSSQTSCPCPDATPFRCPADQRCVTNITTDCLQCPTDAPVRCWDGSCSEDESGCPCPLSNPLLCSDNTTCVSRMSDCEVKCGKLTPVKCWNGACATSDAACPCSENLPFRCATDGKCYSSMDKCPCEDKTLQRCTTGRCVANTTTDCTSTATTCPAATPVACNDGSCAATSKLCGCAAAMATQLPLVEIATTASSFDVTRFLQLAARVNYTVCGKDWTLIVSVVWSATEALTGKAVSGNLFGRVVSVPPNTFSAGTQYIITAAAFVNGSTTRLSSSASVIMLATAPTPELYMVGGNRTTPATNIGVAVQIKDAARTNADVVAWVCTGSDGVSACDSSISTPLLSVTGGFAQIPGPVAAGTYILTAFYKGISASMWLTVKATPVPNVQIIAPQDRTGALKSLFMYAAVQNGGKTSVVTWYIGGTAVMTGSVLNYTMPTSTTAVIAKACDNVDNTACGQATYNYVPVTPVTGTCSLTATDGTSSTAYTALATALSVSSTWSSTTATLKFAFYLEYRNNGVRTRIQLAPYDSEVSTLAFTAPMLAGNQAAQITVGVIARDAGSRETVATAVCDSVPLAASTATTASIVTSQTSQLASALAVNDTSAVFSAAGVLAAAAGKVTGVNASQLASQVLTAISSVVSSQSQDGSTMSRTARSAVIQTLSSTVTNAGSALTSAQQDETVKTVIAAITSPDSQNSIDVNTDGPAALALLSQVNATAAVSDATEKLSLQLAASATLGVPTSISSGNVSIAGVARTGDDIAGAVLNHSKCSLALPSNFNVSNTNSSSTVSLSVAQYDNTPVGTGGLNTNTTVFKSAIVEFNVQADGNRVNVSQLTTAIRVELQVTNVVNASQLTCRYFDKTAQVWTTNGVTTVGYDATRQVLKCDTTHLSMFGGSETTVTSGSATTGTAPSGATPTPVTNAPGGATASPGTPATPTPAGPSGATPAPPAGGSTPTPGTPGTTTTAAPGSGGASPSDSGPSSSTVGAIVGGCIAGLFCVVVAGFLVVRSRANHGTGFNGDVEMADNSAPLTAMGQQLAARPGYNQL